MATPGATRDRIRLTGELALVIGAPRGPDRRIQLHCPYAARHGDRPRIPEWLIGLIAAVVLVAIVLLVGWQLGFGDNPLIG